MLFDAKLSKTLWTETVATAGNLVNRFPIHGHDLTPDEVWNDRKPDRVRVFGIKAMTQVPKMKRRKWDPKSRECFLIGFEEETKGYHLYDPRTRCKLKSREFVFVNEVYLDNIR